MKYPSPRQMYVQWYALPAEGQRLANSAQQNAERPAANPAIRKEMAKAGPACSRATAPTSTYTPAPIVEPTPEK